MGNKTAELARPRRSGARPLGDGARPPGGIRLGPAGAVPVPVPVPAVVVPAVVVVLVLVMALLTAGGAAAQAPGAQATTTTVAPTTTAAPVTTVRTTPPITPAPSTTTIPVTTTAPPASTTVPSTTTTGPPLTIPTGTALPPAPAGDTTTTTEPGGEPLVIDELPPEMQLLIDRYRSIERSGQQLLTQLSMLNGGIAAAERDLADAQTQLEAADRKVTDTERRLADTEDELDRQQAILQQRAVAAYVNGSMSPGAAVLLQSASMDDLGKSLAYGHAVVVNERSIIDRTTELRQRTDVLHREAQDERDQARQARDDLDGRRAGLEKERDGLLSAQSDLARNAQAKVALLSEAAQQKLAVEAGFARVQAVRDSINNTLAERQLGQLPPVITAGIFLSPVPHPKINQPFGVLSDPLFGVSRGHPGIDIDGVIGDSIRAPADGTVVAAGWIDGYGNCTIIDHGNALGTLYGHQSLMAVKAGDTVRRGQVIGFVGSTGYSTGPHLHWEVRINGAVTDPAPLIGDQN